MKHYSVKVKAKKYQVIENKTNLIIYTSDKGRVQDLTDQLNRGRGFGGWTPFFMVQRYNDKSDHIKVKKKNKASA